MIFALLAVVQIGSKAFTESVIVAEMAAQLARSAGIEATHRRELGGSRMAGLLSGMAFASIVVGLLVRPATFGLLLVRWDSYAAPWAAFAALSALAAAATLMIGPAIERARR